MSYLEEAIIECGNLSNKYVELSAPHPYQSLIEISKILKKYKEKGYKFTLHNLRMSFLLLMEINFQLKNLHFFC